MINSPSRRRVEVESDSMKKVGFLEWLPLLILMGFPFGLIERLSYSYFAGAPIALAGILAASLLLVRLCRGRLRTSLGLGAVALASWCVVATVLAPSGFPWRHVVAILLVSLVGFLMAQEDLGVRLREGAIVSTVVAMVSMGCVLLLPKELTFAALGHQSFIGLGIVPDGKMVGLGNGFALLFAVGVVVLLSPCPSAPKGSNGRWILMLTVTSLAFVLSNNLSLVIGVAAALAVIWMTHLLRGKHPAELIIFLGTLTLAGVVLLLDFVLSGPQGRGETLTGRLPIWRNILSHVEFSVMGNGPGLFWDMYGGSENLYVGGTWSSYSSHNSWLTVALDYGWIGLLVSLVILCSALMVLFSSRDASVVVGGGILIVLIVGASTGDVFLEPTAAFALFMWLVIAAYEPSRMSREHGTKGSSVRYIQGRGVRQSEEVV